MTYYLLVVKVNIGATIRRRDNALGAEVVLIGRIYEHACKSRSAARHHVRKLRLKEPDSLVLTVAADKVASLEGFELDNPEQTASKRKAEVARLYSSGMTLRTVASLVPESHETIRAWLVEQGVPIRGRGGQRSELSTSQGRKD